mmetsp:Transcript_45530/g.84335  ORF Transcript_45530/g.84335 Transcript_45530/m.84335 type:complete len:307 (-) Transcript_45530:64-984(-)|eukprot:CAMPEP_0197454198 /NCGR_PEP_ID=MMETSP1175-20131217/37239_1 /TAXON_ID=1003142 /ORGANISM="Triceratium dubium, Strain CCMP147" /LENGTH=306 /DNA_ID=CAMNT_0042987715 /DNA_START=104 /DNA_END=1024 /DNA_ORIENTATION=+
MFKDSGVILQQRSQGVLSRVKGLSWRTLLRNRFALLVTFCLVLKLHNVDRKIQDHFIVRDYINRGLLPYEVEPLDWDSQPQDAPWRKLLNDLILRERESAFWNTYYKDVCAFIESHAKNSGSSSNFAIVEVGTAYGGNADALAGHFPHATIVAVDPLLAGYDKKDVHSKRLEEWVEELDISKDDFSLWWAYGLLYDQQKKHGSGYHIVRELSKKAGEAFLSTNAAKFDVAFIDGLHTYEGVRDDIKTYVKLLKPGGILIFNDYGNGVFPGVERAVDEYVSKSRGKLIVGAEKKPPGVTNAAIVLPR